MKLALTLFTGAVGAISFSSVGRQAATTNLFTQPRIVSASVLRSTNGTVVLGDLSKILLPSIIPRADAKLMVQVLKAKPVDTNSLLLSLLPNTAVSSNPGIYKTAPYSAIVLVPEKHPDDRALINPGPVESSMPMIQPELRLTPRTAPQK